MALSDEALIECIKARYRDEYGVDIPYMELIARIIMQRVWDQYFAKEEATE